MSKELLSPLPEQTLLDYVKTHKLISSQQAASVALSPIEYTSLLNEIFKPEVQSPEKKAQENQNIKLTQRDHFLLRVCIHRTLCKSLETLEKTDNESTIEAYKQMAMTLDAQTDLKISMSQKYSMIARLGQLRTILNDSLLDAGIISKITNDGALNQAKRIVRGTVENTATVNNDNNLNIINTVSDKLALHIARNLSLRDKVLAVTFPENLQEELKNIAQQTIKNGFENSPFVIPDAGIPIPALKAFSPDYDESFKISNVINSGLISDDEGYSASLDNSSDLENSSEYETATPEPSPSQFSPSPSPATGDDHNFKLRAFKSKKPEPESPYKNHLERANQSSNKRW